MQAFALLMLVAGAVAMPYGWDPQPSYAHAPVAYAQPAIAHAPVAYAQPAVIKQVVQPQYVHAAPVVKAIAPAAHSYSTFSQVHVNHPAPIVKVAQPVAYAQPVVKYAQPVAYAQPVVKYAQPVAYAQPVVKQVVAAPSYSHGW